MRHRTLIAAPLIMASAVALGAFGAHGLKTRITPEALGQWNTGVLYQLIHGLALLATIALEGRVGAKALRWSREFFLAGILCFSGSLYLLATRDPLGTQGLTSVLGPVTPMGGLGLIAGWISLLVASFRHRP